MRTFLRPSFPLAIALLVGLCAAAQGPAHMPGEVLVMLQPGAAAKTLAAGLATLDGVPTGLRVEEELSAPMRTWLLRFDHHAVPQAAMLKAVRAHPATLLAQNNHLVEDRALPDDPRYADQWHHRNIGSEAAWDISTGGLTATGDTIVVCIIERVDLPHPDLIANAWFNHAEIPGNGIDDDGNGYVDDFQGWNALDGNDSVYGASHGTRVAGMAGACGNNGLGVAGANWNVKLMSVHHGGTAEARVVAAYTYPLVMRRRYNASNGQEGAFVVATNASWGINGGQPADSPIWCAMYDSLGAAGVLSCGATTNNNVDVDLVGDLPTACPSDFLVSVTATNSLDNRSFSGYGATTIDLGAPGSAVVTTTIGGGYGTTSGTSFASPLTAGVIGLLYSAPCPWLMDMVRTDPAGAARFVRQRLLDGVDQVGNLAGQTVTGGRLSAGNSMRLMMEACQECPPPYALLATGTGLGTTTLAWGSTGGDLFELRYRLVGETLWTLVDSITVRQADLTGLLSCAPYEFQVRASCGAEDSGFGPVLTWTTQGCCEAPAAPVVDSVGTRGAGLAWNATNGALTYTLRWRREGSSTWTEVPGIDAPETVLTGLDSCTAYEVEVQSRCNGDSSDWSLAARFTTADCGACRDLAYCPSFGLSPLTEWIERVELGTIANTSGNDAGYGDHTALSTVLAIGAAHDITLVPGFGNGTEAQYFRVWLDLDRDGRFDGPNELVFDPGQASAGPATGPLTVPASATPGSTRLRVIMRRQDAPPDGCLNNYAHGETEDYCVLLDTGSGIPGTTTGTQALVFPNPADGEVFFRFTGPEAKGMLRITLLDHAGREVAHATAAEGRASLRTAHLASSMYIYRVTGEDREVARGRLVVAHGR